jgi:hypothetical protein
VVCVEHLAGVVRVEPLLRDLPPRHRQEPVEVGADHLRLAVLLAHALQAGGLALGLLAHGLGQVGFGDLGAEVVGDGRVVLAELLADRLHLLAQDVLALLLLRAFLDVLADAAAHLQLRQTLGLEAQRQLEPLDDVDGLQQPHLVGEGDVGGVGSRIGERAQLGDRAEERMDALIGIAQLEDLLDDGAVLALELDRLHARQLGVGPFLDLDPETAVGVVRGRTGDRANATRQRDGAAATRQPNPVGHVGQHADACVFTLVLGHEEHLLGAADVDRQRHRHAREDDVVFERYQ